MRRSPCEEEDRGFGARYASDVCLREEFLFVNTFSAIYILSSNFDLHPASKLPSEVTPAYRVKVDVSL